MALGEGDCRGGRVGACLFCFFSYFSLFLDFDFVVLSFYQRFDSGYFARFGICASLVLFLPPASISPPPPFFFVLFFVPFACVGFSSSLLFSAPIVFVTKKAR